MSALNRAIGVLSSKSKSGVVMLAAPLSDDSVGFRRLAIFFKQLRVGESSSSDGGYYLAEPRSVVVLALIEPEDLFVEISIEVHRVNAHVGPFQSPLKQQSEILDAICVNVAIDERDRVVNCLMIIGRAETEIRFECVV